ncbi:MAG: hypothetical protein DMG70_20215 [Acidobacteria bacterium]|nr:MAG: hypothetical protein DMG70_20215 [Acidobacteriota bacterium]
MWAQAKLSAQGPVNTGDTAYVTCGENPGNSRMVRGDVFISPDNKHRAYSEVEARAIRPSTVGYAGPLCVNNSRLLVRSEASDFKVVFLEEPSDVEAGNSLRVVDWSADSRRLLFELAQWQYDSPGVGRTPVIYDVNYGVFQQPDLNHIFSRHFGLECSLDVHVVGFSPEAKVVIETQPLSPEEEEVQASPSCSHKKGAWLLSVASEALTTLSDTSKVQHYAKTEPAAGK